MGKGMMRPVVTALLWLGLTGAAQAQGGMGCCGHGMAPMADAPLVEIEGKIVQVRIAPGLGMPSIVVKAGGAESVILLGPLRYLMAQNFNPKVGDDVVAKAYKSPNGLVAASVTLNRKTLRLRDDEGRPVWRGGRW
jgi:hypothetical protein